MAFQLKPLPFEKNALEPYISSKTIEFHYGKHYLNYVNQTNLLLQDTPFIDKTLKELILITASDTLYTNLFNQAAQVFNHDFYWNSLTPAKPNIPDELNNMIELYFYTLDNFKSELLSNALSVFGSGWVWLIRDTDSSLKIITTKNAETPLTQTHIQPLLCLDVWEHAYYLDYQNSRSDYLKGCIENLLNWDFAWDNYQSKS